MPDKFRVLLVEDDEDIREAVTIAMCAEGYRVTEAVDGAIGLKLLSATAFDVVVLDLKMPVMDGATFLELKSHGPFADVPVVVFSSTMPSVRLEGYAGVVAVVTKLDGPEVLLKAVAVARTRSVNLGRISAERRLLRRPVPLFS